MADLNINSAQDFLDNNLSSGSGTHVQLTESVATDLIGAGLDFADGHQVNLVADAGSTHLTNSLKGLEKLHIDSVSLAVGGPAMSIDLTHGELGAPTSFADLAAHAPSFSAGGDVTLNVGLDDAGLLLNASTTDAGNLGAHGIDHISLDVTSAEVPNETNINHLFGSDGSGNATFGGVDLGGLHNASTNMGALGGVQIEVGNTGNENAIHLSDANAATLLSDGLSFAEHDNIAVDAGAGSTHLTNSLKGLEKLHIDSVSLAADQSMSIDLTHGELGAPTSFADMAMHAPQFSGGDVTLNVGLNDASSLLSGTTTDAGNFSAHGIDHISLDVTSAEVPNQTNIDGLFTGSGAGAEFAGVNLGGLQNASTNMGALGGVQIEVGNGGSATPIHLSDAHAATLLSDGLSFAEHDNIAVDAGSTHLSTSLQGLQKLHIDSVSLAPDSDAAHLNQIHVQLFNAADGGISHDFASVLGASLPDFQHSADVTLDILNDPTNAVITTADLNALTDSTPGDSINSNAITGNLLHHGIDYLAIHESLNVGGSDWLHIDEMQSINNQAYNVDGHATHLDFQIDISGSSGINAAMSFDDALLDQENAIYSGTAYETVGDHSYGNLIQALTESGVHNFVVDSGNVEITDHLASALINSGMLSALPDQSNLVLDASSDTANTNPHDASSFAHLSTSLKSMADLGVDQVQTSGIDKLYIDLGLPTSDTHAMRDIHDLLAALDPASHALAVDGDNNPIGVSLLISSDMMHSLTQSGAGFNSADLTHLQHLGVTEISVLSADNGSSSFNSELDIKNAGFIATGAVYSALPTVQIIGADDPLHTLLDEHDDVTKLNLPK